MDLIQEIDDFDRDIDDNIEYLDEKLSKYKSMIDIFLKTFSMEVVDFFFEKERDINKCRILIEKEINQSLTIKKPNVVKTEFNLINDIINFKKNFFSKNDFFFYFLHLTHDIESAFFYIIVDKITTYYELNLIKYEVNNPEFKELLNKLSLDLSENFENVEFLLKGGIEKEVVVDKKYYHLIDKINIFLDKKITNDKINDINFLEKRLFELQNNKKKNEIMEKTLNLEESFLEIKEIQDKLEYNNKRLNFLKAELIEVNKVIKETELIINRLCSLKKVDKMEKNKDIMEYNSLIIKKENELIELKRSSDEKLNNYNKDLQDYLEEKKKIEDNSEIQILNEKIKYTLDKNELNLLKIKLKEITEEKYLDLILINNKIDMVSKKIDELKNINFIDLNNDIKTLLNKKKNTYDEKNLDNFLKEKEIFKKNITKKEEIENEIFIISNKINLLKNEYETKNNKFKFKRIHFFKKNEDLFKEFSKLDALIKEFEEYLKILKINLYNFQNNSKIVSDILRTNLCKFKTNIKINICYDNYSDIIQSSLKELTIYVEDILNFKYYNKLVYELFNFTSHCDKKLCNITKNLLDFNSFYNYTRIKNLTILNYNDKLEHITKKYEQECLNFRKEELDEFINKKKNFIDMKRSIKELKNDLEIIEKIKCD